MFHLIDGSNGYPKVYGHLFEQIFQCCCCFTSQSSFIVSFIFIRAFWSDISRGCRCSCSRSTACGPGHWGCLCLLTDNLTSLYSFGRLRSSVRCRDIGGDISSRSRSRMRGLSSFLNCLLPGFGFSCTSFPCSISHNSWGVGKSSKLRIHFIYLFACANKTIPFMPVYIGPFEYEVYMLLNSLWGKEICLGNKYGCKPMPCIKKKKKTKLNANTWCPPEPIHPFCHPVHS